MTAKQAFHYKQKASIELLTRAGVIDMIEANIIKGCVIAKISNDFNINTVQMAGENLGYSVTRVPSIEKNYYRLRFDWSII